DRARGRVAAASAHSRARRTAAHRGRGYVLLAQRRADLGQWAVDRGAGAVCPQCWARDRVAGRGAGDPWAAGGLIPRHRAVDALRPRVDAPGDVVHLRKPLLDEVPPGREATAAVVALK